MHVFFYDNNKNVHYTTSYICRSCKSSWTRFYVALIRLIIYIFLFKEKITLGDIGHWEVNYILKYIMVYIRTKMNVLRLK